MHPRRALHRTLILISLLFLAAATCAAGSPAGPLPAAAAQAAAKGVGLTDQMIIIYNEGPAGLSARRAPDDPALMARLSQAAGAALTYRRAMSGGAHVLRLGARVSESAARALAERLAALPGVAYARPDSLLTVDTITPTDPYFTSQADLAAPSAGKYGINVQAAWEITTGSSSTVVAVIDTGLLGSHPDLSGRWVAGYDFVTITAIANDGDVRDSDASDPGDWITGAENASGYFAGCPVSNSSWHGSHVAGTIAAASNNAIGITGINWAAKILPVRVLGKCGGYTSDIIDGMRWAAGLTVSGAPANPTPAKVINLSLGGPGACDIAWQSAVNDVTAAGAVVVAAAGNNNLDASGFSPASCSGVVTVAAVGETGSRAYYSNYGTAVDIAAPGGSYYDSVLRKTDYIFSTVNSGLTTPTGTYTYYGYAGTSQAAPHVAGVVSLMLAVNPTLTPAQVVSILQASVTAFPAGSTCTASTCGAGILNAGQALVLVSPPGAFSKTAPADAAGGQALSLSLSWGTSAGAASYEYCLDTFDNNACDGLWTSTGAEPGAALSGLAYNTTYYWQARAVNAAGTTSADGSAGAWRSFTTQIAPPGAFSKVSPADAAGGQAPSLSLTWGISAGAASYAYCLDTVDNHACDGLWTSTGAEPGAALSGLAYNTTYYWQAQAVNASGTTYADGSAGAWRRFSTQIAPPGAFSKTAPADAAGGQALSLSLSWGTSAGAASYAYCLDTVDNNACDGSWTSTGAEPGAGVSGLAYNTTYYWQARAVNSTGPTEADGGAWRSFTTQIAPPGAFSKVSPADAAGGQALGLSLAWGTSAGADSYAYCLDTSDNNACDGSWTNLGTATGAPISGLADGTTYFWQVRAVNSSGTTEADSGAWASFTTAGAPPPLQFIYLPCLRR
jgi:serine protease